MYLPKHFQESDVEALLALMRARPLAALAINGEDGPVVNHIPLLASRQGETLVLRGHVARANPLWRQLENGPQAVAVFQGDDAYITPAWDPDKTKHGKVVPTWNYRVAHARGRLRAVDDPQWLRAMLHDLTAEHEAAFDAPWRVDDAPADYIDKLSRAIVGIELAVERLDGKFKLSQNESEAARGSIREGLAARGQTGVAVAMR
ncbi:FMN-binding negative transcriptional regulator [Chromobacterium paludis]|uniref:FMN-binding negative transcriptional regulator n=1 Tax=Chromobacterium paludis TaxID=2605945 RepID=A0A5C1DFY1_9NEIS|nr:FMN-binding negative transcriptional regulator [Chromobacterium paludis]QEL55695.1 FMN-binding negative transcriptional regulator [Chromobacterium paludis]